MCCLFERAEFHLTKFLTHPIVSQPQCSGCPSGVTTVSAGSTSSSACSVFTTSAVASGYTSTGAGGTLLLTAGTYSTATLTIGKAISIACTADNHGCILDGENDHRVVYVRAVSGTAVNLTGLKITRGGGGIHGAGVYISTGSVTMTDCFISDNTVASSAVSCIPLCCCCIAGWRLVGRRLIVCTNRITFKNTLNALMQWGGGVYVGGSGIVTLVNCVLEGNSAEWGGGMSVSGAATLYGCTFASNTARSGGADIYRWSGTVSAYSCAAGYYGGTQGASLSTSGTIPGSPFSFSGCTECPR